MPFLHPRLQMGMTFLLRDAASDVSGAWLSQTSLLYSNASFSNQFDLAGTYKSHRLQSSIIMQGSDGNMTGVGPITIGDKFLLKDINAQILVWLFFQTLSSPFISLQQMRTTPLNPLVYMLDWPMR